MVRKRTNTTLKDIANVIGCSISQVSAVLNNSKTGTVVSAAKRELIRKTAAEMGYTPDFASQALRKRRTDTIGIYMKRGPWSGLSNSYETAICRGISRTASEKNFDILFFNLGCDIPDDICTEKLDRSRCDGVIIISAEKNCRWIQNAVEKGHKLVSVGSELHIKNLVKVSFDEEKAVETALEKLCASGHRRIGFISHCLENPITCREEIFRSKAEKYGCEFSEELIFNVGKMDVPLALDSPFCQMSGKLGMEYFKRISQAPTAVIAADYLIAVSAMQRAAELGINIPSDMSMTAIDDHDFLEFLTPQLSVVDHRLEDMGSIAAQKLIEMVTTGKTPDDVIISPRWIERSSIAKADKGDKK